MLDVRTVDAGYIGVPVLRRVTIEVGAREIVAILGANGAGKSTLLKTISGLLQPTAGELHFGGRVLNGLRPDQIVEAGLVQVPEGRRLFQHLSVRDNLLIGNTPARARRRRRELLDRVFGMFPVLAERLDQDAGTLSGGEQQMLAIGRALMAAPELLMLDEPSLGLAPGITHNLFVKLKDLNREGLAILVVEQNVPLALDTCDRGYVIEAGGISLADTAEALRQDSRVRKTYLGI